MSYPKWIVAHGGVRIVVHSAEEEQACLYPPQPASVPIEPEPVEEAESEASDPPAHTHHHTPMKKGAKKK